MVGEGSVYDVKDHPRSRGVYLEGNYWNIEYFGSSPLARGLHSVAPH